MGRNRRRRLGRVGWTTILSLALVAGALASPAAGLPTAEGTQEATERTCLTQTELGGALCAQITVGSEVACRWVRDGVAECTGTSTWSFQTGSLALPGEGEWVTSSILEFCPPGGACRGYGVGFPYRGCSWEVAQGGCGEQGRTYVLSTGEWTLGQGECLEPTLTTWGKARAYTPDEETMTAYVPPPLIPEAQGSVEATDSICG